MSEEYPTQWLEINEPCTVIRLIHELTEIAKSYGDLPVVVTGCYGSSGDILDIGYQKYKDDDVVLFYSDICSG